MTRPNLESNLALGRPATQSSTSAWSKATADEDAVGGNNGKIDGHFGFHTEREHCPWWQVDLEAACQIRAVRLFNRQVCADRLSRFSVLGSRDGLIWEELYRKTDNVVFGAATLAPFTCALARGVIARFVRIQLLDTEYLHFCECQVLGYSLSDAPDDGSYKGLEYIIAGHSHMFALGASISYDAPINIVPIAASSPQGYFLMGRWDDGRGELYWEELVRHSPGRTVILIFHGNQHFADFLFTDAAPFDFLDVSDKAQVIRENIELIPRAMVKASPSLKPHGLRELVLRLFATGCQRVVITGTPPVRDDFVDQVAVLRKDSTWRDIAAGVGVDISTCAYTDAPVMKRLWGVMQEALCEAASDSGAQFLPVPKEALDGSGYLSKQFRGPLWNFTHANEEYGSLMLKRIVQAVTEIVVQ